MCKKHFTEVHHFYDQMCPPCAELNFAKRTETADLRGRVALLTGGRVKIGYQAGIKLLRAGASLIVSTRFPRDATPRYAAEPDFDEWADRLEVYGLDLRYTPDVEDVLRRTCCRRADRLDFIINNACQTVRRPPEFYAHMLEGEHVLQALRQPRARRHRCRPCRADAHLFPDGVLDQDLQQVDLRDRNSWRLQTARGVERRAARDAAGQRGRAVRAERAAQAADAAHARARQAHRQRVGGRGAVLPEVQDDQAPAHEHGQGGAQHDDADVGRPTTSPTAST